MTGEERKEKLSHKQAKILMTLTTVIAPIAAFPVTTTIGEVTTVSNALPALIWHLGATVGWDGWGIQIGELSVLNPGQMIGDMLWTLPTLLFAYKVLQYLDGQSSRVTVNVTAIISIIVPLVLGILTTPIMLNRGFLVYSGPVPIQLIVGLLLARGLTPRERDQRPIDEELKDRWWKDTQESHTKQCQIRTGVLHLCHVEVVAERAKTEKVARREPVSSLRCFSG